MSKFDVLIDYQGTVEVEEFGSFTAAVGAARREVAYERLIDASQPRSSRRKFTRTAYERGKTATWTGESASHPEHNILISVSRAADKPADKAA